LFVFPVSRGVWFCFLVSFFLLLGFLASVLFVPPRVVLLLLFVVFESSCWLPRHCFGLCIYPATSSMNEWKDRFKSPAHLIAMKVPPPQSPAVGIPPFTLSLECAPACAFCPLQCSRVPCPSRPRPLGKDPGPRSFICGRWPPGKCSTALLRRDTLSSE